MSEISVQFKSQKFNGYNKEEVDLFLKKLEGEFQQRAATIDSLQQEIKGLEAKLATYSTPEAVEASEKIELYDQLMKKMDGEFKNLLAPAMAKAKAIEDKAAHDYEVRMDQARATADGIYEVAADRIAEVVDQNMDRLYGLLDEFIYSKSLPGRVQAFLKAFNAVSAKVARGFVSASKIPAKAYATVSEAVQKKVGKVKTAIDTYKQKKADNGAEEADVEAEA